MRFKSVNTLDEALRVLEELGGAAQVLAGGTDVMIQLDRREIRPTTLVHIEKIDELTEINANGDVRIGSLVTHSKLSESMLEMGYSSVAEAAATVGGWQTQAVGTIGGNVCNASPAADVVPPLLVHDATVTLRSTKGERNLSLDEFIVGRRATKRRPDELLTAVTLVGPKEMSGDVYLKVGRRAAMEIAIVGLAVRIVFDKNGLVKDARVALASVGPRPLRVPDAENILLGRKLNVEVLEESAVAILRKISPIDDVRASESYRRRVVPQLLRRAARICAGRAGLDSDIKGV